MIKKKKKKKTSDFQTNNNYIYIHFYSVSCIVSFPAPLSLFLTTLSCVTHEHILFRSHSRPALLRASGDVHCSLDKGSLLLTTSLSPPFLPFVLFHAHICLLSTALLQGSFRATVMQLGAQTIHMHIYLNPRQPCMRLRAQSDGDRGRTRLEILREIHQPLHQRGDVNGLL